MSKRYPHGTNHIRRKDQQPGALLAPEQQRQLLQTHKHFHELPALLSWIKSLIL